MICPTVIRGFKRGVRILEDHLHFAAHLAQRFMLHGHQIGAFKIDMTRVGVCNWKILRPVVDFPQPDSPTKPRVSPRWMSKETPSTARTAPICVRNNATLRRSGNVLRDHQLLTRISLSVICVLFPVEGFTQHAAL